MHFGSSVLIRAAASSAVSFLDTISVFTFFDLFIQRLPNLFLAVVVVCCVRGVRLLLKAIAGDVPLIS